MTWRTQIANIISDTGLTDIYEFGVYSGESVWDIQNLYNNKGIRVRKFFCFDSFVGLPQETAEPIAQDCWHQGGFNACEKFGVNTVEECINHTNIVVQQNANFDHTDLVFIPGFFEDTLTDDIVERLDMKPAAFVDLDADIYSSTYTALDFMFRNNLIVQGTLIAYDDWGGTPGWELGFDGESRAHREMCEKYQVQAQEIVQFGTAFPHVQKVFKAI
jgi:hypothetical protein